MIWAPKHAKKARSVSMKKKIFVRCLIGAPIGMALSTMISIVTSAAVGDGTFYAAVPELIEDCGTELNAVILQALVSLLYGAAWGGASVIWETEEWSLLRQTATHLAVSSIATFPVAWFMRWMNHSILGAVIYFGIFIAIYLCIWGSQYFAMRRRIRQMNEKVREK